MVQKDYARIGRTEEVISEIDRLANEDHAHIATEEELDVYRGNWWIRSNLVGSDTMPARHRPEFKKRCLHCTASRKRRTRSNMQSGSCVDWTWSISLHLPCRKQFQYFFNSQQWIDTWRSKFKQQTVCVLLACWSKRWRSQRSRKHWFLFTATCQIRTKQLEKASGHGILDWYWSWNHQRRIEVLSNKIERNYPSRGTSSKLHCKSWMIEKWRKIVWKAIFVSSSTEDLFEHTILVGQREMIKILQLNINQLENSFNNHLEKHFKLVLPSQPNPLNPLKIELGNLWPKRLLVSRKENLVLLIERNNLWKRKKHVLKSHDRTGELGEGKLHQVQKNGHLKNCDDADKFNLAMDDENIDFNISGVQMRWWNDCKALALKTWLRKSKVILHEKHFTWSPTTSRV